MPYTYQYPRPCVTVDIVVFRATDKGYCILLIKRKNEPFKDAWALPGGFIEMQETLEESAARELREETGLTGVELHQLGTFGDPDRDPRGRTITVAYYALDNSNTEVKGEEKISLKLNDVIGALKNLGYKQSEITPVINKIKDEDLSIDEYIRKALKLLLKNR